MTAGIFDYCLCPVRSPGVYSQKGKGKNKTDFTVQKKPMFFGVSHSETIWKNSENPNWSTFFCNTRLCKSQSVSRSLSDKSRNGMPDLILST